MEWDPTQYFRADDPPTPFALVILNQPINEKAFSVLREHSCITICADGGANRYYEMMRRHGRESLDLPSLIIGDLDSIHPEIRTHYDNLGVPVIEDPDQYSTDFTKCLTYLHSHAHEIVAKKSGSRRPSQQPLNIIILGGLGGRVDQAFSQIHHLYMMTQQQQQESSSALVGHLYLVSEESITFILRSGKNIIRTPGTNRPGSTVVGTESHFLEENVGIIPLSGPASITTAGFEWDVADWSTEIGGQISTSNHIRADVVEVASRTPVLFTLELASRFKRAR
ncbi:hypothetical protein EYZ11_013344 [Aspergillus tanneri]|uniref:Thiamine pyrophosphokinase n=1 Tax=Aspergillus tanneri TaxID=1220188 RepID=A0A4S3J3B8_9EURO|nr:uncharacterized protein ATNIH1004_005638 [Aspergillus tanneri]KAA8646959.1 hypothetical protein ATNIH1004_005638 [Aspergillus tanneri]THC87211.1 hypothetical protein EYZ11_013344 [Aspergillus tanneri]